MADIYEFDELDPTGFHLVGQGANGFSPLLAKAAAAVGEELEKAKLKAKERDALPDSDFALPGREYPIHDENHADAALSMLHNASPEDQKKIKAAVHRRYPDIDISKETQEGEQGFSIPSPGSVEGQGRENHPGAGPHHMDNQEDCSAPKDPSFTNEGPTQSQEGYGDTAPDKTVPMGEALSQTHANARKAGEGDGRGDPAPDGEAEVQRARGEAVTQTNANTRKDDPGSPEWEAEDAELAEQAGSMIDRLASREKAEAAKGLSPVVQSCLAGLVDACQRSLQQVPTATTKEIDDMTPDELVKLLDERDAARQASKAAAKAAAVEKASKKKAKVKAKAAAMEAEMAEKAANDPEWAAKLQAKMETKAAKKAAKASAPLAAVQKTLEGMGEQLTAAKGLLEDIAKQPIPTGVLNAAGIAAAGGAQAVLRGQDVRADIAKSRRADGSWSVDDLRKQLAEAGNI